MRSVWGTTQVVLTTAFGAALQAGLDFCPWLMSPNVSSQRAFSVSTSTLSVFTTCTWYVTTAQLGDADCMVLIRVAVGFTSSTVTMAVPQTGPTALPSCKL